MKGEQQAQPGHAAGERGGSIKSNVRAYGKGVADCIARREGEGVWRRGRGPGGSSFAGYKEKNDSRQTAARGSPGGSGTSGGGNDNTYRAGGTRGRGARARRLWGWVLIC
jgi:hypothetical protein